MTYFLPHIIYNKSKEFFTFIIAIHIILFGLLLINYPGINLTILRQIIGFIYLTFVPGILVLRSLKIVIDDVKFCLLIIGTSLSLLMIFGALLNILGPRLHLSQPLSLMPIAVGIFSLTFCLTVIAISKDSRSIEAELPLDLFSFNRSALFSQILILSLLPVLSILGTHLVNINKNNIILIIMIILICLIILSIAFCNKMPKYIYCFIIFFVAISLLFHNSLISEYIWGWDIHLEYALLNEVIRDSYWDFAREGSLSGMLSITVLPAIYIDVLGISLENVFKIMFIFWFSLVPIGLYEVYRTQIDHRLAFLSTTYFMSLFSFYLQMPTLARQELAEFFFVLILLLLFCTPGIPIFKRKMLLILFSFSLISSHYGLTYIFIIYLIIFYLIMKPVLKVKNPFFSKTFILFFITTVFLWYSSTTSGTLFDHIVNILENCILNIQRDIFATTTVNIITSERYHPTEIVTKNLYFLSIMLMLIGFISVSLSILHINYIKKISPSTKGFSREYLGLSLACFCVLSATIFTSRGSLDTNRLFQISSIIISPFCVCGLVIIVDAICYNILRPINRLDISLKVFSIFIVIFLLFNISLMSELIKDYPHSISLSQSRLNQYGPLERASFYNIYNVFEQDVYGVAYLSKNLDHNSPYSLYADYIGFHPLVGYGGFSQFRVQGLKKGVKFEPNSYIFLGKPNIADNLMLVAFINKPFLTSDIYRLIYSKNKVYSNGACEVYNVKDTY